MAINLTNEELVTLSQAAEYLPKISHNKVHISTLWRWCKDGLWGNYLEYLNIGSRIFTSIQALQRFFIAVTQSNGGRKKSCYMKNRKHLGVEQRKRSIQEANRILQEAKII